jgi:hypothetical protein
MIQEVNLPTRPQDFFFVHQKYRYKQLCVRPEWKVRPKTNFSEILHTSRVLLLHLAISNCTAAKGTEVGRIHANGACGHVTATLARHISL